MFTLGKVRSERGGRLKFLAEVKDVAMVMQRLEDVRPNLMPLTKSPDLLLYQMREYGVVLSGSRAAEYFAPGASLEDSDWGFYYDASNDFIEQFVEKTAVHGIKCREGPGVQYQLDGGGRRYGTVENQLRRDVFVRARRATYIVCSFSLHADTVQL
ncbi:hypothetical protein AYL99_11598 [Fonsecaea erecta]|uniref:Uncharacterized protein n=1 Tax=Fonsecaea erecta TaxID=1367422 RepID=A0A178Z2Y6_9EURO|nr:hypothetical protein AYL99_11598 [Fonsecaea erecta]OAP54064.1 hypothetical protein AYL99_11598 [Fonsecaea erecta]